VASLSVARKCSNDDWNGQNTQGRAQLNPERDAVKNNLSLGACPKGLTDVIEF